MFTWLILSKSLKIRERANLQDTGKTMEVLRGQSAYSLLSIYVGN